MGGAKQNEFIVKQKIITFANHCIFIAMWMEFECQVLSLTFSKGACSQDCIFLMKMVQAGSLISEMELLWYCFTPQMGCCHLERLFFPHSAIFHGYYFFACHIPFRYLCGCSLTFLLTCFRWGQSSDLWLEDFFILSVENRKKFHSTQIIICSLESFLSVAVCNSVMSVGEIKKVSF